LYTTTTPLVHCPLVPNEYGLIMATNNNQHHKKWYKKKPKINSIHTRFLTLLQSIHLKTVPLIRNQTLSTILLHYPSIPVTDKTHDE